MNGENRGCALLHIRSTNPRLLGAVSMGWLLGKALIVVLGNESHYKGA